MLTLMYLALAVIGAGFVLVSVLLGHLADTFDSGADHAGDSGGDGASFHFPFFSPLALAMLGGSLGAWGLITRHGLGLGNGASLVVSIPLAVATAYAVTYAGWRLVRGSQGTSTIRLTDLVGAPGEVLTPIPAGGAGEVATSVGGQRFTAPARELQGREVRRGAAITVVRVVGATLLVSVSDDKGGPSHG